MDAKYQKFFLGANSCKGFESHFSDCYDARDGWCAYIIKGGPGTGKSSFMRHFASHAIQKGEEVILCPCSSDPESLDGVILPRKKTVLLDGTAPHVVEPSLPGVSEEIINLGEFWDAEKLKKHREAIIAVSDENKRYHKKAACYLAAAGQLLHDRVRLARGCTDIQACEQYAQRLGKTLLQSKGGKGKEWVRFLQGATPVGVVSFSDTLKSFYENRVIICDPHGAAASIILSELREYALSAGYEIITVKNAFLPDELIDHILIPELSLGIMTESRAMELGGQERRIHARRFTDIARIHAFRSRLTFDNRAARELIGAACESISEAKAVHDKLEKYYISSMDHRALTAFAEKFVKEKL